MLSAGLPSSYSLLDSYRSIFASPDAKLFSLGEETMVDKHGKEYMHLGWEDKLETILEDIRKDPTSESLSNLKKIRDIVTFFSDKEIVETLGTRLENAFDRICSANKTDKTVLKEVDRTVGSLLLLNEDSSGEIYSSVSKYLKDSDLYLSSSIAVFVSVEDDYEELKDIFIDKNEWDDDTVLAAAFLTLSMEDSDLVSFLEEVLLKNYLSSLIEQAELNDSSRNLLIVVMMLFLERLMDVIFENGEDDSNKDVTDARDLLKRVSEEEMFTKTLDLTSKPPRVTSEEKKNNKITSLYEASQEVLTIVSKGSYSKFKDSSSITLLSPLSNESEDIVGVANIFIYSVCAEILSSGNAIMALFGNESLRSFVDIEKNPNEHDSVTAHYGILLPVGGQELKKKRVKGMVAKENQRIREREIAKQRNSKYEAEDD